MFNINMNMFESYDVVFEVYVEDKSTNKQTMQAPKEILIMNFIQTMKQIGNDRRAIKLKMSRKETIWDNFDNKEKILDNEIEFMNNSYVSWQEKNKS